jgi:hypothetical protein
MIAIQPAAATSITRGLDSSAAPVSAPVVVSKRTWARRFADVLLHPGVRLHGPLGLLFAIAVWAFARPYRGVRHDAVLYAGQTIHRLWPERLQGDVFFLHGSQDQFSVFSRLLGGLFARFGLAGPEMLLLAVCQALFAFAVWKLAGHFTRETRLLSVVCTIAFPHAYASVNTFGFAENFLSARSLAEPLALFALFAWARRRLMLASALFAASVVVHPLMALPLLIIVWLAAIQRDRRWTLGVLGVVPVFALAVAGVKPFDALFVRMDKEWWTQVESITQQILISSWDQFDWLATFVDIVLLATAARAAGAQLRQLLLAILSAAVLLVSLSFVAVDIGHNALIAQLQLWRVLWVAHLFALMCLPTAFLAWWRRGGFGPVTALALVDALLATGGNLSHASILCAWFALAAFITMRSVVVSPVVGRAATAASIAVALLATFTVAFNTFRRVADDSDLSGAISPWLSLLSLPVGALALSVVVIGAIRRAPAPLAWGLVVLVLLGGVANWDQRSPWSRYAEARLNAAPHPFLRFVGPQSTVMWGDDLRGPWLVLQRSAFNSDGQGAGAVFHRGTAIEFGRQHAAMVPYEIQRSLCRVVNGLTGGTRQDLVECSPTPDVFEQMCHASPHPDFMVLQKRLPAGLVSEWTFVRPGRPEGDHYYLYDCSHV